MCYLWTASCTCDRAWTCTSHHPSLLLHPLCRRARLECVQPYVAPSGGRDAATPSPLSPAGQYSGGGSRCGGGAGVTSGCEPSCGRGDLHAMPPPLSAHGVHDAGRQHLHLPHLQRARRDLTFVCISCAVERDVGRSDQSAQGSPVPSLPSSLCVWRAAARATRPMFVCVPCSLSIRAMNPSRNVRFEAYSTKC